MSSREMVMTNAHLKPLFTETFGDEYLHHLESRKVVSPTEILWLGFVNGYFAGQQAGVKKARQAVEHVERAGLIADDGC